MDNAASYHTAQISNNGKYLANECFKVILAIYDLKEDRIIKVIENNGIILAC